jgi:hypothetical protein
LPAGAAIAYDATDCIENEGRFLAARIAVLLDDDSCAIGLERCRLVTEKGG